MILYEECKRLDKVRGQQKVVEGKLRDQCMLCMFYEMCNSCFFFGSSNAEKEVAIADMVAEAAKEPEIRTKPQNYDIDVNALYHKPTDHYIDTSSARKAAILDRIKGGK